MIVLRRLGGQLIALNPDLIERVETTPDTVVTLVDDKKFLIEESLDDVLRLITDYRAYIIARSRDLSITDYDQGGRPVLHVVPNELVGSPAAAASASMGEAVRGRFGEERFDGDGATIWGLDGSDPAVDTAQDTADDDDADAGADGAHRGGSFV